MKFRIGLIALALFVTAPAFADDGTWNAGASNLLSGLQGRPGSGNAGASQQLPNGTGSDAKGEGRNSSIVCNGGRCYIPEQR